MRYANVSGNVAVRIDREAGRSVMSVDMHISPGPRMVWAALWAWLGGGAFRISITPPNWTATIEEGVVPAGSTVTYRLRDQS